MEVAGSLVLTMTLTDEGCFAALGGRGIGVQELRKLEFSKYSMAVPVIVVLIVVLHWMLGLPT